MKKYLAAAVAAVSLLGLGGCATMDRTTVGTVGGAVVGGVIGDAVLAPPVPSPVPSAAATWATRLPRSNLAWSA